MNQTRNLCLISPPPSEEREDFVNGGSVYKRVLCRVSQSCDAFHSNAATDAAKDKHQWILIVRRMKMQPVRSAEFKTSVQIPPGFHGSREIPLDL